MYKFLSTPSYERMSSEDFFFESLRLFNIRMELDRMMTLCNADHIRQLQVPDEKRAEEIKRYYTYEGEVDISCFNTREKLYFKTEPVFLETGTAFLKKTLKLGDRTVKDAKVYDTLVETRRQLSTYIKGMGDYYKYELKNGKMPSLYR